MSPIVTLTSTDELHHLQGRSALIRFEVPRGIGAAARPGMWAAGGAVAYVTPRDDGHVALVALGGAEAASALVVALLARLPEAPLRATLPRGGDRLLSAAGVALGEVGHWDYRWTERAPAPVAGEEAIVGLDDDEEIAAFLATHSPTHSLRPGSPRIVRWAGVRDDAGRVVACGAQRLTAHTRLPHLASIAVDTAHRGRGLGAAVTAWLTRRAVVEAGICTLGQYAANPAATRLYDKLGYHDDDHHTTVAFA